MTHLQLRRQRGGYLLVELLFGLALFTVFGLVAAKLFHFNFRTLHQTTVQSDATTGFDAAMQAMRRDLSRASSFESPDTQTLLVQGGEGLIRWQTQDGRVARMRNDVVAQSWSIGATITFKKDGQILLVQTGGESASASPLVLGEATP